MTMDNTINIQILSADAQGGDVASAYVVQLPWPFADKQAFPCNPLGLAKARELVGILKGPGMEWPSVRIIKRTEEMVA